jgi:pimeloyl-ACP methyl ester carboxylesterase
MRRKSIVVMLAAALAGLFAAVASAARTAGDAPTRPQGRVDWRPCPNYSDEVLAYLGFRREDYGEFRELMARTECGTVEVPLDHRDTSGEKITIALTRVKASDARRRLGSLAVNPGGPGGSGYLMPHDLLLRSGTGIGAALNERYDLIGFDPRGVGYSTKYDCDQDLRLPTRPITEPQARQWYAELSASNKSCSESNPAFLRQLTTLTVARDLDRLRAALGERELGYFGVSWGTFLGAVYRSQFPRHVSRMWLDSTAVPELKLDEFEATRSKAMHDNFLRMTNWLARHTEYGFGDTNQAVLTSLKALMADFDSHPRRFDDVPFSVDGSWIAFFSTLEQPFWPEAARMMADLRDATGPNAPESFRQWVGPEPQPPPAGAPEFDNPTMGMAVMCNEDLGTRDFETTWEAYQQRLVDEPVTGSLSFPVPTCAGWTLDPQPVKLRRSNASLVMSGHLWEWPSPYQWTGDMQDEIGGTAVTVRDDVHGSAAFTTDCAALIVRYFATGRPGETTCDGASNGVPAETGQTASSLEPFGGGWLDRQLTTPKEAR